MSAEYPIFHDIEEISCFQIMCSGVLEEVPISKMYHHLLYPTTPPPIVAECNRCKYTYTNDHLLDCMISAKINELPDNLKPEATAEHATFLMSGFANLSSDKQLRDIQETHILRINQSHNYLHHPSCLPKKKAGNVASRTLCRYPFPGKRIEEYY